MSDPNEADSRGARPTRSRGLAFVGLLVGAVLVAVLIGQLAEPDPPPRPPPTSVAPTRALDLTPEPDVPIGVDSINRCPVQLGGLILSQAQRVRGSALEIWDCDAVEGPWSVVIRAADGHFGFRSAVVTFPIVFEGSGVPSTRPDGGVWNPGSQKLVWPLGSSHAQIVGDLGQATLENLAIRITLDRLDISAEGRPSFWTLDGFSAAATTTYRSPVVREMRYGARDLGQARPLGDGLVHTGVTAGAAFESQALESIARPAGFVRGKPAIYSTVQGANGTLSWESTPGEVHYIGYSGSVSSADAIEALRDLADKGRLLTPAQWQTKDRQPVDASSRPAEG